MLNGEDMRRKPFIEYKAALRKLLRQNEDIQYVAHIKGGGAKMFQAVCKLGLEGIVSKKLDAPYRSGPSKNLDQGQEPEGTRCGSRFRWDV
jgi:bifunctional non-homologous end joining protein LigD